VRRTHHRAEPSCPGADEDVPSCTTGPGGQLRFVARELAGIARSVLSAASRRDDRSVDGGRDNLEGGTDQSTSRDGGIAR
jgi:hypothetical protein